MASHDGEGWTARIRSTATTARHASVQVHPGRIDECGYEKQVVKSARRHRTLRRAVVHLVNRSLPRHTNLLGLAQRDGTCSESRQHAGTMRGHGRLPARHGKPVANNTVEGADP
jgi:hypothetical protein